MTEVPWLRHALVEYVRAFLGVPYRWGGEDPIEGFDCSGLVCELLQAVGLLKHDTRVRARDLEAIFKAYTVSDLDVYGTPGVLLFWGSPATHVAVTVGHGLLVDASGGGASTTSDDVAAEQDAFVKMRPQTYRGPWRAALDPFAALTS